MVWSWEDLNTKGDDFGYKKEELKGIEMLRIEVNVGLYFIPKSQKSISVTDTNVDMKQ